MFYYWLKFMMRIMFPVFYRRMHRFGYENIPKTGPFILACNHPNSFLDAMLVGAYTSREIHFLARADVFNSPLKLWILSKLNLIPIYRLQEGAENLEKNKDTFDRCHKIFRNGGAILIFSEGLCIQEMRLRPLKKGTARIAMEYSKDGSPLTIIPTGLNYMKPMKFREAVLVGMDTAFNAADFAAEYNENPSKGINSFNKKLLEGLQRQVIDIREKDKEKEKDIAQLVEMEYNNTNGDLKKLVSLVKGLNEATDLTMLSEYRKSLENFHTRDEVIAKKPSTWMYLPALLLFGLAYVIFLIPVGLSIRICRTRIRLVEFKDSVFIGCTTILSTVHFLFFFFFVGSYNWLIAAGVVLGMYAIGYLAGPAFDVIARIRRGNNVGDSERTKLQQLRESVLHLVKTHQAHHPVG